MPRNQVPWHLRHKLDTILKGMAEDDGTFETRDLAPLLQTHYTSSYLIAARQDHIVTLQGEMVVTSPVVDEVVFTFPMTFEPSHDIVLPIFKSSGSGQAMLAVDLETRVVTWKAGAAGTYTLSGVSIVDPYKTR